MIEAAIVVSAVGAALIFLVSRAIRIARAKPGTLPCGGCDCARKPKA